MRQVPDLKISPDTQRACARRDCRSNQQQTIVSSPRGSDVRFWWYGVVGGGLSAQFECSKWNRPFCFRAVDAMMQHITITKGNHGRDQVSCGSDPNHREISSISVCSRGCCDFIVASS